MKNIKLGSGFTVFILFFGFALIEAIRDQHWLRVVLWIAVGIVFLLFDIIGQRNKSNPDS